jgi:hypothetical protein
MAATVFYPAVWRGSRPAVYGTLRSTKHEGTQLPSGHKKTLSQVKGFSNKYGSYLLSRILVQYHRP